MRTFARVVVFRGDTKVSHTISHVIVLDEQCKIFFRRKLRTKINKLSAWPTDEVASEVC